MNFSGPLASDLPNPRPEKPKRSPQGRTEAAYLRYWPAIRGRAEGGTSDGVV